MLLALSTLALCLRTCAAVPGGTTEYGSVQIANDEWSPEQTFGNSKANLQIGVQSNQTNSFQDIGFGYVGPATQHKPPAVIAYEQTSDAGQTNGDLVFGTRSTTVGSTAATAVMRIRASGAVEVDGAATMSETLNVNKDTTLDADLIVTKAATAWTHSGGTSLTVTSTNGYIKLVSTSQYVDVESVRFTDDYIGVAGDTDIIRLTSTGSVATVLLDGKLDVTDDVRIGDTSDPKLTVDASNGNTVINGTLDVNGDAVFEGQVLVKGFFHALGDYRIGDSAPSDSLTIKAATNQTGDMTMMDTLDVYGVTTLYNNLVIVGSKDLTMNTDKFKVTGSSGNVETLGSVTMHAVSSVLTHDGAAGSLAISSSTGPVTIEGQTTGGYVDVESIRFTDNQIGSTGDPDLITIVDDAVTIAGGLTTTTMAVTSTFGVTSDFTVNTDQFIVHSSNGNVTMKGDLEMEGDTATLSHSGSTGGLAISSAQHVDVESVRFTGDQIGSTGDPDLITLTADNVKVAGTLEMSVNSAALTHSGTTSLAISSTNGHITIAGGSGATDYVDVEGVRFTDNKIGSTGDANLITLVNDKMSLDGALDLTNEDATITHTASTSTPTLMISSTNGPVSVVSDAQYVDVESVRFTGDQIGLDGDTAIMQLTTANSVGNVAVDGTVTMIDDATSLTHTGATSLTISSSQAAAFVKIQGGSAAYVQVESVKITDNQIGTVSDANLITLEDDKMSLDGALDLTDEDATITHTASSGTPTLTISSTNGPVSVVSDAQYVDVESVRFTGDQIGLDGDTAIMQLTTANSVGNVAVDGTVTMIDDATSLTHTGATSLTISSSQAAAFVKIQGGSAAYVQVESVKITDNQIGTVSDANLITLEDDKMSLDGALDLTDEDATITHTASSGTPTLTISSTNGPVSVVSDAEYVDVESVRFTGDQIGLDGDIAILELTTAASVGNVAIDGTVTMIDDATSFTHTGTTSFAISSINGVVTIAGGSGASDYVDVEDVRFTGDKIGLNGDTAILQLTTVASVGKVSIDGTVEMIDDATSLTHTGTTSLAISSTNGHITIAGGADDYVDVESIRFTDNQIGPTTDTDLITLSDGNVEVTGTMNVTDDVTLTKDAVALTHSGTTSLAISSTNGHITIAGGSGATDYVDVESVRFTDNKIGSTGDANLITLVNDKMSLDGALDLTNEDATITHTASTSTPTLAISSTNGPVSVVSTAQYVDVESVRFTGDQIGLDGDIAILELTTAASVGNVAIDGTVTMIDDATSFTHTGTTSFAISSINGVVTIAGGSDDYVDVESIRFTDHKIGISTDTDILTLTSTGSVATVLLDGKLDVTDDVRIGDTSDPKLTVDASNGNTVINGTLDVNGDAVFEGQVLVKGFFHALGDYRIGDSAPSDSLTIKAATNQTGDMTMMDTLDVYGVTTLYNNLVIVGSKDLTMNTDKFKVTGSSGNVETLGSVTMHAVSSVLTHDGAAGSLAISSSTGPVTLAGNTYVDVESIRFTSDKIGLNGDDAILQLTSPSSVGNVAIDGTVEMIDDTTSFTHTGTTSLAISSTNGHITIAGGSSGGYVDVESIRFTNAQIGISTDTDIITLTSSLGTADVDVDGTMGISNTVTLSEAAAELTHSGATSLTISSSQAAAFVKIEGGALAYVDVESVRFTDNQIGISADTDLITLTSGAAKVTGTLNVTAATQLDTTLAVTGAVTLAADVTLTKDAVALTHSGDTSLAISSTNGHITIAGGSGATDYVDVESVRFTNDYIGISGDTDIIRLTSAGAGQATVAIVADVDVTGTMDVSSDFAIGTTKFKVVESSGAVSMSSAAQTITHSGATSLTISSSAANAFVKIEGGASAYVDVESVRFTDNQIGSTGHDDLITLVNNKMSLDGALDLTNEDATITHTASTSTPTLTISSTNGPVSVVSTAQYVDVEAVRFTGDQIGLDGDIAILELTTSGSVGNVAIDGTVTMIDDATSFTHTGTTSLAISSTNGHITIAGGSDDYVDVESVRFTDNQIGISADTDIITLTSGAAKVTGTLNVTAATQLDTTLAVTGAVTLAADMTLTKDAVALTHSGDTSLAISSTNGHITIAGGSGDYVDVESVRFTDNAIGISTDTDIMTLTSTGGGVSTVAFADKITTGALATLHSAAITNDFTINTNKFKVIGSSGDTEILGSVTMKAASGVITHDGALGSLAISSSTGPVTLAGNTYVDVESIRFTSDKIGLNGDDAILQLTSPSSVGNVAIDGTVEMIDDTTSFTHTGTTSLAISSTNGHITIAGGSSGGYVDVESIRFTNAQIGISTDTDIITLTSSSGTADVDVDGTMGISNTVTLSEAAAELTHSGATSLTISSSQAAAFVKIEGGASAYVDVESVRFTDNQIGISADTDLITLTGNSVTIAGGLTTTTMAVTSTFGVTSDFAVNSDKFIVHSSNGNVTMKGDLEMEGDTATLTHSGSTGGLAISSAQHVDVESVRFTGDQIGSTGDPDLITLTTNNVKVAGTLEMSVNSAALTHSGTTGLAISSTNGHITIAGGSGATDYVDVESVRFTNDYIGISGDTDIIRLTSAGAGQATVAIVADVDVTGTMDVSSDFAIGTTKFKVVESSGAVSMSSAAQTITHSGATSLTISSSAANAFVKIEGGASAYVDVESVRFTDNQIGSTGHDDLITLVNNKMSLDGALDLTNEDATITHTASTSTPTLTISSTNGPVSVVSTAQYVDVEAVRFTGDQIGLDGDIAILELTTSGSVGNVAIDGTVTMIDDATSFTHTGTTRLAISSTNGHITIAGGSDDYVDVESVRFTDNQIGPTTDADLITLSDGNVEVTGTMNVTDDVTLTKDAVALTHSGTTSLAISSTNGHITIAGGSDDYVDVESVRFTDNAIGISTDTDIMTLTSTGGGVSTVAFADKITTGALATLDSADITNAVTVGSDFTINTNKFKVIGSSGDTEILGSVTMKAASGVITHDGASGSLAISSSTGPVTLTGNTYVDVESVRFTNAKIGLSGDDDIMTLTSTSAGVNNVAFADKITTGDLATLNSVAITNAATVGTTLGVTGDFTVNTNKFKVTASDGDTEIGGDTQMLGSLTMKAASGVITHDGASGSLAISSSTGPVTLTGNTYVDVESIRFTSDKIGLSGDDAILQLTTSGSVGKVKVDGTVEMIDDTTSFTHTGTTSLAISSTNGHITIAGGSDDYVDVESVRFTDNQIGISADTDIITLTSGAAKVTGTLNVTAATQLDTTLAVTGAVTLAADVTLTKDAVALTHSGTTSLAISSTNGHITIAGGSGDYVDVESVRFTDNQIGSTGHDDLITLVDNKMSLAGALDLTVEDATITHTGSTGTPTLTITSSNGPVSVQSTGDHVDVESVRFTGAQIGLSGDVDVMTLSSTAGGVSTVAFAEKITTGGLATLESATVTNAINTGAATLASASVTGDFTVNTNKFKVAASDGNTEILGSVTMKAASGVITHDGAAGSLAISSSTGPVTLTGNTYVDVESVRFTNANIGLSNDDDLIALAANDLTVNGAVTVTTTMDVTGNFAVNTNKFKVTGTNGNTEIFGAVSLTGDSATITHSGGTGLTIESAAGQYVDVEDVRITDNKIGVSGSADLLTLTSGAALVTGTLASTGNFAVAATKFTVDSSDGATVVDGTLGVNGAATFEGQVTVKGFFQALGDYRIGDSTSADTLTVAAVSNYTGDTTMMEKLDVYGTTTLHDELTATSASLSSTLGVSGTSTLAAATMSGTLGVTGHTTATSATLSGAFTVNAASTLNGQATVTGAVSLSATAATITHTGTGGATNGLAITSTQGYVDVESVRFTADEIGTTNDPDLVKLADNSVTVRGAIAADTTLSSTGDLAVNTDKFKVTASSGAVSMSNAAQTITHSGATSLTISSSQAAAFVKIEGGASAYVDVESVRFTDNQIGISADTDLITLTNNAVTIAGGLTTTTMAVTSTFGVTSDFTVNTDKFIVYAANGNTEMTGNLEMSGDTATLSHSGSTGGLAISSAQHVDVESVRFTSNAIGSTGDPDLITLTADNVKVAGTLEMSVNSAALTHSGTTGLAISSTNGYVTIAGGTGDYVDVEGVKFNDDTIKPTSSSDHLTITGGTGATDYVDIESVRFTNAQIGLSGDTDLIALAANDLTVNGAVTVTTTMDVTGNFAVNGDKFKVAASDGDTEILGSLTMKAASGVITHDGASGSLAISSSTGPVTLTGNTYVDVESVRFTNAKIGLSGDDDIMTLTSTSAGVNNVAFADKITTGDLATLNSATVTTTLHSGGDFTVGSGPKLTVTASSGDVVTDGKVAIAGAHGDATKALYVTGSVYATGTVTSASDARFKRDVRAIEDPLAIARALEPVTFEFRRDEFPARDFPAETQAGFLAQDLESVLPHLVSEDDGGYKGVAYERVGVYALAGVKALDDKFERRNGTVAELEARVAYLERALAALISKASGPEVAGR